MACRVLSEAPVSDSFRCSFQLLVKVYQVHIYLTNAELVRGVERLW